MVPAAEVEEGRGDVVDLVHRAGERLVAGHPGHESLGLALSLLSLGARSAVAAVAPVPDDVAAATMERHHELLAAGVPSDEALARAVDEVDDVAAAFLNLGGRYHP